MQAAACRDRADQGLQLRRRGRLGPCGPPALQHGPRGKPGAHRAQRLRPGRRRRRDGDVRPPLSAASLWPRYPTAVLWRVISEPGGPAEAERAVDQHLVPADRDIGADLEVGPAQLVLDLLVALLHPVPQAVDPHHLGQGCGRVRAVRLLRAAGAGQVGDQVPGGLVRQGAGVGGGHRQAPGAVRPHQPKVASAANQVSACPDRQIRADRQPGPEPRVVLPLAKCRAGVYGTSRTG